MADPTEGVSPPADEPARTSAGGDSPHPDLALGHADSLRAMREVQYRAEVMLALAGATRIDAAERAEVILSEARSAADHARAAAVADVERRRHETVEWVVEQRALALTAIAQLREDAERDVRETRTDTMRSVMVVAEQTARSHVADVVGRGARDADRIRGAAHTGLLRAAEVGADLQDSLAALVVVLRRVDDAVSDQLRAIDAQIAGLRRGAAR